MPNRNRETVLPPAGWITVRGVMNIRPEFPLMNTTISDPRYSLGTNITLKIGPELPAPFRRRNCGIVLIGAIDYTLLDRRVEKPRRPIRNQYRRIAFWTKMFVVCAPHNTTPGMRRPNAK